MNWTEIPSCGKTDNIVRNAQIATRLLQDCCLVVIKPMSGCVRIAWSDLVITSLAASGSNQRA